MRQKVFVKISSFTTALSIFFTIASCICYHYEFKSANSVVIQLKNFQIDIVLSYFEKEILEKGTSYQKEFHSKLYSVVMF